MKGDFSFLPFAGEPRYTGVLQQQGRVLLDRDWNEAALIAARWRAEAGRDSFGDGVMAVPASSNGAFRVLGAKAGSGGVRLRLGAGRGWVDGLALSLAKPASYAASYYAPPLQSPQAQVASIAAGVRDLVVLEVWEDTVSAWQDPQNLLEPALGGPDTTERTQAFTALKLLRLGPNDDCSAVAALADDFSTRGRLTVSPAPVLMITGDCPVDAGGGYTGLEHTLFRVEIAEPDAGGQPRFKWSRWNGGLVGRGEYHDQGGGVITVDVHANAQMIDHCGVDSFYLEALGWDAAQGSWTIQLTAQATRQGDGLLGLSLVTGAWPAGGFFRLWNGIEAIAAFPKGSASPGELDLGIRLEFDAPTADNGNYRPGDWWTFPARAAGADFESPPWPVDAPPRGLHRHRVALGILNWNAPPDTAVSAADGEIDDCRRVFRPLSNQKVCCTFNVGDGRSSHGDFDSIEEAIQNLPKSGGEICLLPGVHATNAVIAGRRNVVIKGCDTKTRVIPRAEAPTDPIFTITASSNVRLEHMDLLTLAGAAIVIDGNADRGSSEIEVGHNRIVAFVNAISARAVSGANLHHNRIRMIDKKGGGVAIYHAGDDGLIERNDIRLIPAPRLPPITTPDTPEPTDPGDPCAELRPFYRLPRLVPLYLESLWALDLQPLLKLVQPYKTLGGIQLGGGSERVRVLENTVICGAGNGITLGSSLAAPAASDAALAAPVINVLHTAVTRGTVTGPDGKPAANAQITLTETSTGKAFTEISDSSGQFGLTLDPGSYALGEDVSGLSIDQAEFTMLEGREARLTITLVADAAPVPPDAGFLYRIAIERNRIEAMGLSGIGVAFDAPSPRDSTGIARFAAFNSAGVNARRQLATPVVGLAILGNRLLGNLLDLFDRPTLALAATQGLGGISLGLCDQLEIADNEIARNGSSAANPACGIFVAYGEDVQIVRNRIVDNGVLTRDIGAEQLQPGQRGGIVLKLVSSFNLFDAQALAEGERFNPRPALRVHENVVDQPVGQALRAIAFGPVQCTDNAFSCELSGLSAQEKSAGVVYLFNLGGVTQAGAGVALAKNNAAETVIAADRVPATQDRVITERADAAPAVEAADVASNTPAVALDTSTAQRSAIATQLLPGGDVMFSANQARAGAGNSSRSCQLIASFDDLAWQDNQSTGLGATGLFTNGLLFAQTLRATGNRLRERNGETPLSLLTVGVRANDTSFNQADHCIVATDMNPTLSEVKLGNQILNPGKLCASRSLIATNVFKPQSLKSAR